MNEKSEARAIYDLANRLADKKLREFKKNELVDEVTAKVVSTSPLTVYLRDDATVAASVKNPRGLVLNVGDMVRVRLPNFKNDNNRYVDYKL